MPIHLPPISRREFLAGSLAAGAGLLLPSAARATEAATDPNRYALLSDIHIWERRDGLHGGVNMTAGFSQARGEILALEPRPAAAIVTGDCAYLEGHAADYAALVGLVKPIRAAGLPLHFALGNHDHHGNFRRAALAAEPTAAPTVPGKYVSVLETPRANWFLLDSLEKPPFPPYQITDPQLKELVSQFKGAATNWCPGSLGKAQLDWLAKALDARPDKPAILLAHHYPSLPGGLRDTAALQEVMGPRRQVKAYVFGHSHTWRHHTWQGIHMVNLPPTAWVFDPLQPRGWVDMHVASSGASLVLNSLDPKHPKHGQRLDLAWRKDRA